MFIIAVNFCVPGLMCCDVNIEHKNKLKLMLHHIKFYFVTSTHTFPQSQHLISLQDKDSQNIFLPPPFHRRNRLEFNESKFLTRI